MENAPWYFTVRFICKLTARQNRSITNRLPLDYQICKIALFSNRTRSRRLQKLSKRVYDERRLKLWAISAEFVVFYRVALSRLKPCPEHFTPPANMFCRAAALQFVSKCSLPRIHAAKFPIKKRIFSFQKADKSLVHGALSQCRVPLFWFMLMWSDVISNKQSIFSSQILTPSFPINWPSLVSSARSPIILWRLWSHTPSHKRDSN